MTNPDLTLTPAPSGKLVFKASRWRIYAARPSGFDLYVEDRDGGLSRVARFRTVQRALLYKRHEFS